MKQLAKTKVTVRLRKAEDKNQWYVYIESYPVEVSGKKAPQRILEYLNRSITTVEWDKKRTARTDAEGVKSYKPRRSDNGIIMCRSDGDRKIILYADGVRKIRQKEYDNIDLYSDAESLMAEQKERGKEDFIKYIAVTADKRHARGSKSIQINWERTKEILKSYSKGSIMFSQLNSRMAEDFKLFLLGAPLGGGKKGLFPTTLQQPIFPYLKLP
jgi:hypothetical protein